MGFVADSENPVMTGVFATSLPQKNFFKIK